MERVEHLLTPSIDELYAELIERLPAELRPCAISLPQRLGLAPMPDVKWSEVFSHAITLGAPRLVAAGMPGVPASAVRDASLAHLLAIVEAFGTDRILDGQIEAAADLDEVLAHARRTRDEAIARVAPDLDPELGYARAEERTAAAIHAERRIFESAEAVSWARYLALVYDKQRLGLPASLALATAAGWDARRKRTLARMLDAVWIGLQLHDDVIDWEEDMSRGGAWALALASGIPVTMGPQAAPNPAPPAAAQAAPQVAPSPRGPSRAPKTVPISARKLLYASGVLVRMLRASARCFRAARRRARVLGLSELAAWAAEREAQLADLAAREAESPGQTNRAHALSQWAKVVLGE
jgi:hypothetical protein